MSPIRISLKMGLVTLLHLSYVLWKCNSHSFFVVAIPILLSFGPSDENHKAFKDPLHVPVGPITKARSKKIKEALNGLIQEIWADSNIGHSKLDPKEDEGVINLIQAIEDWSALIGRDLWRRLMADWLSNPILVNSHFSYSEIYYFRSNPL